LSAALSLYAVLSLAPLLVISLKLFSIMFGPDVASRQVESQMQQLIGPAGAAAIKDMLLQAAHRNAGIFATVLSFILLFFTASAVFGELQDDLDIIWNVKPRPDVPWWQTIENRFLSMAMVFVIMFLLLVSMIVSAGLTALTHHIAGNAAFAAFATDFVVSMVIVSISITLLFRFVPDVRIDWRDVFLGALVTAVLFKLGQYVLGLYFRFGSTTSAYGAAGSFVAVLLWVYYSGWILFFGAEFTSVYAKSRGRGFQPTEEAVPLSRHDRVAQDMKPTTPVDPTPAAQSRIDYHPV